MSVPLLHYHADYLLTCQYLVIKSSALSASEKALVLAALKTYGYDLADADAATLLAKYTAELDNTYLAYSGITGLTTRND